MQVTVTFRRLEATEALRRYADEKVRRIAAKYFRRPLEAHVVLAVTKRRHMAEITLTADRVTLNAREETADLYSAIDLALDKIERQAKKYKAKRRDHKNATGAVAATGRRPVRAARGAAEPAEDRPPPEVIRTERVPPKPMSVEEAVMQMDLSNDEFLVFTNAANETLSVLYRRKDGNYGLIEPDVR
jgi:putative sigma-54 modulation protein